MSSRADMRAVQSLILIASRYPDGATLSTVETRGRPVVLGASSGCAVSLAGHSGRVAGI